ncbi:protein of unknown function DUF6 transmembrane [Desulfohalobium retbaense DSM 5692]|uniref:EamA domain-containing protein n=2 Tax=Desulfohalobium TaxID=45662 RepID=C8WZV4_DESRD|nr:protein of unknown function DUF6 transmembrane [Desulfohalobium retbaense DSM 5692]
MCSLSRCDESAMNTPLVYVKLLATVSFWGGTFVAGRVLSQDLGPFEAAFLRFLIASVFLVGLTLRVEKGLPRLPWRDVFVVMILGATGVFAYNACFFAGLQTVPAGRAALIIASNPACIALVGALVLKQRLRALQAVGVGLCLAGAAVVISDGAPWQLWRGGVGVGELFILGCVASWVAYSLVGKVAMHRLSPFAAVTYSCLAGTLFLAIPASGEGLWGHIWQFSGLQWGCLAYLGICGTGLGFSWYYQGIKAIGPARASVFINFVPVTAILAGFVFLDETIGASLIVGALCVGVGVYLTNRFSMAEHEPKVQGAVAKGPAEELA